MIYIYYFENMKKKLISFVVPVYKKGEIIDQCLMKQVESMELVAKEFGVDFEILAVVDGNLDNSAEVIENLNHPKVKLLTYEINRGKGFAVRYGMMHAKGDYVGFVDAGLDIDFKVMFHLSEALIKNKEVHIAVASKTHKDSQLVYPLKRRIFTKGYVFGAKLMTGINYSDTQAGAKLFTKEVVDKVLPRILVKRYAFDIEILAVARRLGYEEHIDVPIDIDFTIDESSATNFKQIFNMMWDTAAVGYRLRIRRYYDDSNKSHWEESLYDLLDKSEYSTLQTNH